MVSTNFGYFQLSYLIEPDDLAGKVILLKSSSTGSCAVNSNTDYQEKQNWKDDIKQENWFIFIDILQIEWSKRKMCRTSNAKAKAKKNNNNKELGDS